nr:18 kD subunit of NADH dehydrogenase (ubiquinone) [Neurospora crassa]
MSALRITTASAARMLRTSNAMMPSVMGAAQRRALSDSAEPARVPSVESARVPEKLAKEDSPLATPKRNSPDYNVPIDKATSTWTPVPKHIQNGSEEGILPAAVVSGAPMELQARTVRIYLPSKPATQSSNSRVLWHGLGRARKGPPLGKRADGLAIVGRLCAGHAPDLPHQGGGHSVCREARVRVLCAGAEPAPLYAQGVRQQLFV